MDMQTEEFVDYEEPQQKDDDISQEDNDQCEKLDLQVLPEEIKLDDQLQVDDEQQELKIDKNQDKYSQIIDLVQNQDQDMEESKEKSKEQGAKCIQEKLMKIKANFGEDPQAWPPHGTEVFLGGIPREADEAQIKEFCEEAGEVYQFVFSKDEKSNINKGFGYCTYKSKSQASAAAKELHEKELKGFSDKKIRISLSEEQRYKVFVSNLPRHLNKEQLQDILEIDLVGIESIDLLKDKIEEGKNRGFCFIEFLNCKCAEYAKQIISDKKYRLEGNEVFITWAEAKKDFAQTTADKSKEIYVGNLPKDVNERGLQEFFETKYGPIGRVVIPKFPNESGVYSQYDYGFIHFQNAKDAKKALNDAEQDETLEFEGKELIVKGTRQSFGGRAVGQNVYGRGRGRGRQFQYEDDAMQKAQYNMMKYSMGGYQQRKYDDGMMDYQYQQQYAPNPGFTFVPMMPYMYSARSQGRSGGPIRRYSEQDFDMPYMRGLRNGRDFGRGRGPNQQVRQEYDDTQQNYRQGFKGGYSRYNPY